MRSRTHLGGLIPGVAEHACADAWEGQGGQPLLRRQLHRAPGGREVVGAGRQRRAGGGGKEVAGRVRRARERPRPAFSWPSTIPTPATQVMLHVHTHTRCTTTTATAAAAAPVCAGQQWRRHPVVVVDGALRYAACVWHGYPCGVRQQQYGTAVREQASAFAASPPYLTSAVCKRLHHAILPASANNPGPRPLSSAPSTGICSGPTMLQAQPAG